ncbi:MAG TPA: amidohydrolase family protein [Ruminiclostridium sp.]|nr:amidohydrolase family protein [Ruminiclostridium sp.]
MRKIFDFHTHAYPEKIAFKSVDFLNNYYKIDCQGNGTIDDLLCSAKDGGVGYLLVHAVATKPSQVENVNTWISEHLSKNVFGFGTIHPDYEGDILRELERIRSLGLLGLKLHPDFQGYFVDDPSMDIVYKNIEGKMPVLIHTGDANSEFSSPRRLANVLDRYPNLTVISAHLGGYSEWDNAEKYIVGKNCYIDTSSSIWALPKEKTVELIRKHGVDRVLFGTDYPLTRHKEELERFLGLGLTEEENNKILFENAKKLLNLDI